MRTDHVQARSGASLAASPAPASLLLALAVAALPGCFIVTAEDDAPPDGFCGDGFPDFGEQCDDGNNANNDGCSRVCVREELGRITTNWTFKDLPNTTTSCPSGFGTARVVAQPIDGNDDPVGQPFIDLYDCERETGSELYPAGRFRAWIDITDNGQLQTYAQSLSAIVDLTTNDQTIDATILNNGGYFSLSWELRGKTSNNSLTCAQVAELDGVETVATLTSGGQAVVDKFNCAAEFGVTGGLLQGSYTVSVDAFQNGGPALGTAPALINQTIRNRNAVTDLGHVVIPIDGQ